MLTKHETEMVKAAMNDELQGRGSVVFKCAAGIALVLALSIVGPVVGLSDSGPQTVATAGVLERLAGIAN